MESLDVLGKRAKAASRQTAKFKITKKNEVLEMVADELIKKADEIKKANKADVDEAVKNGMKPALIDRLTLTDARIEGMAEGLRQLVALEDPVGEITSMKQRPNGLMIGYKKVPLGDRCNAIHHDGTNHYLYRAYKDGVSDTQIENLKEKLYRGIATRADITRVTRRLGDEIAHVYGFPIPRRQAPVQER